MSDADNCDCPIHARAPPQPLPLGVSLAGRVRVTRIRTPVADRIYRAHHSYRPSAPGYHIRHHGIMLDGRLAGAVSYCFPENVTNIETPPGDIQPHYDRREHVKVARVCVGVDVPNLASAGFARSQRRFVRQYAERKGVLALRSDVRDDHRGSMFRALRDLGWRRCGPARTGQPGNRPNDPIHSAEKTRWLCPLETGDTEQQTLSEIAVA